MYEPLCSVFLVFVLEESKPPVPVKVPEAPKKPEVTDQTKKVEKRVTPQEEVKPGILSVILKEMMQTLLF